MNKTRAVESIRFWEFSEATDEDECDLLWKWYGTATFQAVRSLSKARKLFYRWADEVREAAAPLRLNWVAVIEQSRFEGIRIHVIVGGQEVKSNHRWALRWQELTRGDAVFYRHHPGRFYKYVRRQIPDNRYYIVDCDVCGWGINSSEDYEKPLKLYVR